MDYVCRGGWILAGTVAEDLQRIRESFVQSGGNLSQALGAGRAIGQVFAHIYFSPVPQTLDHLTDALGISKGSASMCVRQLEQWGALRRVWVKGDRKIYHEASREFGNIVRRLLSDVVGRTVDTSDHALTEADEILNRMRPVPAPEQEDWDFVRHRVRLIRDFRKRVEKIWHSSIVKLLLQGGGSKGNPG